MASAAERPTRRVLRARAFLLTFALLQLLPTSASPAPQPVSQYDPLRLRPTGRIVLAQDSLNLNCGGDRVGRFVGDQYSWLVGGTVNTDKDSKPNVEIKGAEAKNAPALKNNRYGKPTYAGKWGYKIPVENPGIFACTVHFAEIDTTVKKGQRVFNLEINAQSGSQSWKNIDVVNETGVFSSAVRWTEKPLVVTRYIEVLVQKTSGSTHGAIIGAITCERSGNLPTGVKPAAAPAEAKAPIVIMPIGRTFPRGPKITTSTFNVNCGGSKTVGKWVKDEDDWKHYGPNTVFPAPKPNLNIGGATGDEEIALRDSAYGYKGSSFGYQIPVAKSGLWECHLLFTELDSVKMTGVRVFDVQVQDQKLPRYDIMKAAGGSIFTKTVLTFVQLPVVDNIAIQLGSIAGKDNPSINAIECMLKKPLSADEAKKVLAANQMKAGNDPETPSVSPSPSTAQVTTIPTTNISPAPSIDTSIVPSPQPQTGTDALPDASPGPSDLVRDVTLENVLEDHNGEVIQYVRLGLSVPKNTIVDNNLKDAIKNVVMKYSKAAKGHVAVTVFKRIANGFATVRMLRWVGRLFSDETESFINDEAFKDSDDYLDFASRITTTEAETSFECGIQYQVKSGTEKASSDAITKACSGDECTKDMEGAGCTGCTLKLLATPTTLSGQGAAAAGGGGASTSTIVAAVVGSCLVALLLVAVIIFFVVQRNRRNEVNPAAFDAPPPEMEDSDGSAPSSSEHSESQRSVDYLDDDSTFTAATSHQADPEAGVTLDKDVWGRGSS